MSTTTRDDLRARAAELREIARSARRLDDVRGMLLAIAARLERLAGAEAERAPAPPAGSARTLHKCASTIRERINTTELTPPYNGPSASDAESALDHLAREALVGASVFGVWERTADASWLWAEDGDRSRPLIQVKRRPDECWTWSAWPRLGETHYVERGGVVPERGEAECAAAAALADEMAEARLAAAIRAGREDDDA